MKRKIILPCILAAGLWLHSHGFSMAYDPYPGIQGYRYDTYGDSSGDYEDTYPGERQERRSGQTSGNADLTVLGIISVGFLWLFSRSRGGRTSSTGGRSRSSSNGDSYDYSRRFNTPKEESPSYASRPDPSAGHFWGNPEDGTTVKSLWGTTKDE